MTVTVVSTNGQETVENQFIKFQSKFGKKYTNSTEYEKRLKIFSVNLDFINQHNTKAAKGISSYTMGINQFSDLVKIKKNLYKRTY